MHDAHKSTTLQFVSLAESVPGAVWSRVFEHGWSGWRSWAQARGADRGPDVTACRLALSRHMPEFVTTWERLVEAVSADEEGARFLSFWCPPRYLVNCTQAVLVDQDGPLLVRNYDLDPLLNESTLLETRWRHRRVLGMVEGMAGLADGLNDAGLAISLSFGGRVVTGRGFGIPLIVRYVLEVCSDTPSALEALRSVPCHMSYNVTVVDSDGDLATVMLSPDRPPMANRVPYVTNHQLGVEWPRHGRLSNTVARGNFLASLMQRPGMRSGELIDAFLRPPLFETSYERGFGTVYTAAYRPRERGLSLLWPDSAPQPWRLGSVDTRNLTVRYTSHGSRVVQAVNGEQQRDQRLDAIVRRNRNDSDRDELDLPSAFWR